MAILQLEMGQNQQSLLKNQEMSTRSWTGTLLKYSTPPTYAIIVFSKKHWNSLTWGLFFLVNVLHYFKIAQNIYYKKQTPS